MRSRKRTIISFLLTLLLTLCLFSILQCIGLSAGLYNKEKFQNSLVSSQYYKVVAEELANKTAVLLNDYKLPQELGEDLWTQAEIYRDMNVYTKSVLEGEQFLPGDENEAKYFIDRIKKRLHERFESYFNSGKIDSEKNEWDRMKEEVTAIIAYDYESTIDLPLIQEFVKFSGNINRITIPVIAIGGCFSILIIILLYMIYRHKHKSIRYIVYALFSASILNVFMNYFLKQEMTVNRNYISDTAYRNLCNEILADGWNQANIGGITGFLLALLLSFFVIWMRNQTK